MPATFHQFATSSSCKSFDNGVRPRDEAMSRLGKAESITLHSVCQSGMAGCYTMLCCTPLSALGLLATPCRIIFPGGAMPILSMSENWCSIRGHTAQTGACPCSTARACRGHAMSIPGGTQVPLSLTKHLCLCPNPVCWLRVSSPFPGKQLAETLSHRSGQVPSARAGRGHAAARSMVLLQALAFKG